MKIGSSVFYQYKFDYKVDGKNYADNHSVLEWVLKFEIQKRETTR
jgi:hypothetical protein